MLTIIAASLVSIGLAMVGFSFAMENRPGWAGVFLGAAVTIAVVALVLA